ncbi:MAG TPA: class I SAM-dependent methyltransferase [Solirubrobacteraceae bacterium]|nr:class I SAM-dependent methyltransferase [Solirubrobacteraceae bacterium]
MRPTPAAELLALQDTLYASRNPTRRWLHAERRAWIEAALGRLAAGGARRAIEVGPGSGVYLPLMVELFASVTAVDVEEAFLARAREVEGVRVVRDDVTRSALPAGSFDVVLCSEVIEHLRDPRPALLGLRRLLAPGGRLVISTPLRRSPLELLGRVAFLPGVVRAVRAVYREPILPTGHVGLLSARALRRELAAAGFRVLEEGRTGLYLPVVAELGGERGQRLLARLARPGRLLWTQLYVCDAP